MREAIFSETALDIFCGTAGHDVAEREKFRFCFPSETSGKRIVLMRRKRRISGPVRCEEEEALTCSETCTALTREDVAVTWKSWYTLYSLGCLVTFTLGQLYFVASNTFRLLASVRSFTKSLVLVLPTVVAFKVTVNVASSVFGSWTMLEFFKKSAEHEMTAAFDWKKYRYRCRLSYALRFFVGISFFAHLIANADITTRLLHIEGNSLLEFVLKATVFLFNFLFFTYDMLHFIILRPCCEVLISYVRQEQDSLNYILAMSETSFTKMATVATQLDRVRLNISSVVNLRKVLNSAWQFSIMASAAGLLIASCICIYSLFDEGVPKDQLLLIMSYCGYAMVDFVDVARLSQTMGNEASITFCALILRVTFSLYVL
ncbi:hypothetical protein HPB51_006752 [Rhipicephalus microplus]|uniref:Uncharacterized protein n=1 Tax=Rhipicephalus microplus TaxID=6941 RepID=A0A9J6E884_RHIMP|nr:hypothetical protein HPB51_006752 [Rhipicephalus microplus]